MNTHKKIDFLIITSSIIFLFCYAIVLIGALIRSEVLINVSYILFITEAILLLSISKLVRDLRKKDYENSRNQEN